MKLANRLWTVPLGYLAASAIGALGIQVSLIWFTGLPVIFSGLEVTTGQRIALVIGLVFRVALVAIPFSAPIILFAEWKQIGRARYFLWGGFAIGLVLLILFGVMFSSIKAAPFLLVVFITPIAAAFVYWLVAWKWLGPKAEQAYDHKVSP